MRHVWAAIAGLILTIVLWSALALAVPSRYRQHGRPSNPHRRVGASTVVSAYSLLSDGASDKCEAGDSASIDGATAVTWSAWLRPTAVSGALRPAAGKFATTQAQWWYGTGTTTNSMRVTIPISLTDDNNTYWQMTQFFNPLSTWYHVAIVFDGAASGNANRLKIYRNGTEVTGSGSFTGTIPASIASGGASTIYVSGYANSTLSMVGNSDEHAIFVGTAMSAAQIAEVYNGGIAAIDLNTLALSPKPTHWWRLENNGTDAGTSPSNCTITGATFSTTVPW